MLTRTSCLTGFVCLFACATMATTWDFTAGLPTDGTLRDGARLITGEGLGLQDGVQGGLQGTTPTGFKLNGMFTYPEAFRFAAEYVVRTNGTASGGGYLWDDLYRPTYTPPRGGLQIQLSRKGANLSVGIRLGFTDQVCTISGPSITVADGDVVSLAFNYDAKGHLALEFGDQTTYYEVPVEGALKSSTYYKTVVFGDCMGSKYAPLEGVLRRVSVEPYVPEVCTVKSEGRLSWERAEGAAVVRLSFGNDYGVGLSGVVVAVRQFAEADAPLAEATYPLGDVAAGERRTLSCPVETRVRPGVGRLDVVVTGTADGAPFESAKSFVLHVGKCFAPRMPVSFWGYGGRMDAMALGFTHGADAAQQFGFDRPLSADSDVTTPVNLLDQALLDGIRLVKISRVYNPSGAPDARFFRWRRDGSYTMNERDVQYTSTIMTPAEVDQPALVEYAREVARADIGVFGDHPAFGGVLATSETRDSAFPSFNTDDERYTAETGLPVPDEAVDKYPPDSYARNKFKDGIVPETDPVYAYYRWYWKGGDGWAGYSGAIADEYRKGVGGQPFFSFFDPAVRTAPVWGAGGTVDAISHWCYVEPEPMNVAAPLEEMFAMAEGRPGQRVMIQTQLISKRPNIAPENVTVSPAPEWVTRFPDAKCITLPPDALQEATWSMIAKPVSGILFYGVQSIVDCPDNANGYRYTNTNSTERLRHLLQDVVAPLGPALLKIGRRPQEVAVLESATTCLLSNPRTDGYTAPSVTFLQRARLDPKVVYEESVLSNGLAGVRVLYVPQFRYSTQAVVDRLNAFQRAGGLIIGDEQMLSAVTPDILTPVVSFTAAPLADTVEAAEIQIAEEGTDVDQRSRTVNAKLTMQKQAEDVRAELAARGYVPASDSSSPEIVVYNRQWNGTPYLFAINDRREFGDYVGQWGRMMEKGLPFSGTVSVPDDGISAVYELSRGGEAPFSRADGRVNVTLDFETNDGRLLVFLKERISSVSLEATRAVSAGGDIEVVFSVLGDSGAPIPAVLPVEIRVFDGAGKELDGAGYAAAEGGVCRLTVPTNRDDPDGNYRVTATDRASGLSAEAVVFHGIPETRPGTLIILR